MKKLFYLIIALVLFNNLSFAQLPVSQIPQNKKVVLEQFTGMWCSACSGGDMQADNVSAANPGNVFIVNIHKSTGYEDPNSVLNPNITLLPPAPDFKPNIGSALYNIPNMGIAGFPCASFNRTILSGSSITTFQNNYTAFSNSILSQPAYCNVALQGTLDVQTRVLTIDAEVYYTGNSTVSTNSLTIFLLESNLPGPQKDGWVGGTTYPANWNPDGTYRHNNVLRTAITPTFGVTIPTTTAGTTFSTSVSYTVPLTYGQGVNAVQCLLGRLEILAFVTETNVQTINAAKGSITLTNFVNSDDIKTNEFGTDAEVCEGKLNSTFKFINYGSSNVSNAVFSLKTNTTAAVNYTYTGTPVKPYTQSETIFLPTYLFAPLAINSASLDVININGGPDQNVANNISVNNAIPLSANNTTNMNMQMDFTQDMNGYESKWYIIDEASSATVISGGPYPNLGNGTQLHSNTFTLTQNKCYKLVVTDYKKDGINNFFGSGNYELKSNNINLVTSNGKYGKGDMRWFSTNVPAPPTNIESFGYNVQKINLFPNPSVSFANLEFTLAQNETVSIKVMNAIGQTVFEQKSNLEAGDHLIKLNSENWATGLYNVNISTTQGGENLKLILSK